MKLHNDDLSKLILRIAVGGLMLPHGIHKLINGHQHIATMLSNAGLPTFIQYGTPIGEVIAPILLILGYKTRPAATLVAFTMFVSIFLAFGGNIMSLNQYGGWVVELNMFFMLASVALIFSGSGKYSLSRGQGILD
jgi:putative oxidoreductase